MSNLLKRTKELMSKFCHRTRSVFSKPKKVKTIIFLVLIFTSSFAFAATSFLSSTFFKNNIPISLTEIYDALDKDGETGCTGGVVYYKSLDAKDEIVYLNPEMPREMREIYYNSYFINAYVDGWEDKYSPASIEINGLKKGVSFLLLPKERYVYNRWDDRYSIPLISSAAVQARTSPNDIYITKEYADQLILNGTADSYNSLVGKNINLPYYWNVESSFYTLNYFVIQGVLDTNSDKYKEYQTVFGDFFVVNEYFSMPMPSITFFKVDERKNLLLILETLLDKYDYETIKNNYSSTNSSFSFQTRISFVKENNSNYSIKSIVNNEAIFQKKVNKLFDTFSTLLYLIYAIIIMCICISLLLTTILFISLFLSLFDKKDRFFILIFLIPHFLLSTIGGVGLKVILDKSQALSPLSLSNYVGSIILIFGVVVSITTMCLIAKFKK